jgi:hypothetical protein
MNVPVAVVREYRIVQLSSSSRVVLYMYCIVGTVWGSEMVCLYEVNVRQCVVCIACLCCVVSCRSSTEWLVISSSLDMLFSNTHF